MIDWIKSWFGRGRVEAQWVGIDRDGDIRSGDARAPYVGKWNESAMHKHMAKQLDEKFGIKVTKITIVRHTED